MYERDSFYEHAGERVTHLHCCVTDGVFSLDADGTLRFHPATDLDAPAVSAVQRRIRSRVLRTAVRHGALTAEVAADLARWGHGGGFSLHAAVRIEAEDRAGLERLLRYCAPVPPSPANDSPGTATISRSATPSQNPCRPARPSSRSPRSSCSTAAPR